MSNPPSSTLKLIARYCERAREMGRVEYEGRGERERKRDIYVGEHGRNRDSANGR